MTSKEAIKSLRNIVEYWSMRPTEQEAANLAIKALEQQDKERWIPVSERLPEATGDYLCTVEWYGTSTKKLLLKNGYEIKRRIRLVYFLDSAKSFKECDELCTYKVLAWKNQESYEGE